MFSFVLHFWELRTHFCSADAKAAMAKNEVPNVHKGKKVDHKVEPLTDTTVYYGDFGSGPSPKKKVGPQGVYCGN